MQASRQAVLVGAGTVRPALQGLPGMGADRPGGSGGQRMQIKCQEVLTKRGLQGGHEHCVCEHAHLHELT